MKILIVDDSVDLCDAISKNLRNHGYDTDIVHDGKSGLKMALSNEYDIILLDIMMPQMNGYKVIEKLRNEDRTTPVIFITAKSNIADKIEGLEPGADDYIQKPFNINELLARIKALARRSRICDYDSDTIRYADITLCISSKELYTEFLQTTLSHIECDTMKYFIKNSSVVVSSEKLADALKIEFDIENTVCKCVDMLKRKINYIHSKVKIIAIKGVGYKLCY